MRPLVWTREKGLRRWLQPTVPAFADRFDFGPRHPQAAVRRILARYDLVNLHWVSGLVDPKTIAWIARERAPVVWTLHDMAPFTGGCHYDAGCGRFAGTCQACPQIRTPMGFDYTNRYYRLKQAAFSSIPDGRLHLVAPSNWMADEVRRSPLFRNRPVHVIANPVDSAVFQPRPKAEARRRHGIPDGRPVILFVAPDVTSTRKGGHLVAPILGMVRDIVPDALFVSVGSGAMIPGPGHDHIGLGAVADDTVLAEIFSAADLTLMPSFQDNLPNTMVESMACGVPVASFATGGIGDLVIDDRTGVLAAGGDAAGLAGKVVGLLRDKERLVRLSQACREVAEEKCGSRRQSERYSDLYERVMFGYGASGNVALRRAS